ncbi:AraC family transcriptional regulator [Pontimicrobium sp. SW4]|uniref:AraC family transcriptional regulator n=1 Tax=Pontimicrobium sp. SW4 TaxID=3153519 RepID=A0AAU7BVV8_9FLAO
MIIHTRYILKAPHFTFTGEALTLAIWPLLYLISKKILNEKVNTYDVLHFLPFMLYTIYRFNDYSMSGNDKYNLLIDFYAQLDSGALSIRDFKLNFFFNDFVLYRLQPLIYIIILLRKIGNYLSTSEGQENGLSKKWLRILIYGFLILWVIKYLLFLLGYFVIPISIKNPVPILFIAGEVFLISQLALTNTEGIPKAYVKKKKDSKELYKIAKEAKDYIISQKVFLDPDLNLQSLSKSINTNSNYLSKAIHLSYKINFSDFINQFRIEYAKQLIQNKKYEMYTLEAIAKESGFKSISTFNRSFQKVEKMTPSNYKQLFNS